MLGFTNGRFERFDSANLGQRIRQNVQPEYGRSDPSPGNINNVVTTCASVYLGPRPH